MSTKPGTVTSLGLLILRVGFGVYMMTHGWGKVQSVLDGEFGNMDPIGLGPKLSMIFAAAAEFGGALLVVLGLGTRFGAAAVAFTMGVAAFVAHGNDPWTMSGSGGSKEPALLYMIAFLALVFTGAGRFSGDAWLWNKRKAKKGS